MGTEDIERQALNVFRMKLLGARVIPVESGSRTLKDAMNEAIRDWVTNVGDTHYIIGSVAGPHPYPAMVRDFQIVIGKETKKQFAKTLRRQPDYAVACVGGGSNAIGLFYPYLNSRTELIGAEAGGLGLSSGRHAATLVKGEIGILHGSKSYCLQDKNGQIKIAHSVSAGLDYPGVGPEHSYFKIKKKVRYVAVTDKQAIKGFDTLSKLEGIMPAFESAHAIYYACKLARESAKNRIIAVCLSGRGDKDVDIARKVFNF
jgi:tryptophan synthase beta chain